jgi:hypothetical protein
MMGKKEVEHAFICDQQEVYDISLWVVVLEKTSRVESVRRVQSIVIQRVSVVLEPLARAFVQIFLWIRSKVRRLHCFGSEWHDI